MLSLGVPYWHARIHPSLSKLSTTIFRYLSIVILAVEADASFCYRHILRASRPWVVESFLGSELKDTEEMDKHDICH